MILSFAYVCVTCAFYPECDDKLKGVSLGSIAISSIYSVFVSLVYFTQLTTILHKNGPDQFMQALAFVPGTWIFYLDLFGYAIMALSTLLLGFVVDESEKVLRLLLKIHGLFFPVCICMPMITTFQGNGSSTAGTYGLIGWCLFFLPILSLSTYHFYKGMNSQ